ncbi:TetR/AcrR family transcriptional regulator [Kribbella catacumbae]|uniref:TetR/AcrR family transcriptional regulator n=1 Tax=Kribbella catacumbae TaxID=460086 RepID=UPI000361E055|nr:TetR/AcrR family transcriptional regulator [Kribbella catacumbae]
MVTKTDWLDAGLKVLADEGSLALTIERLTTELGLSKGSYYHHFKGTGGFRTALLEHFEGKFTTRLIDAVERRPEADASTKLTELMNLVLADPDSVRLEIAVRAWALQDPEARAAQERVDHARTAYLQALCRGIGSVKEPDHLAKLLYLILIGAEQIVPPVPAAELRALYGTTLSLATGAPFLI